MDIKFQSIGGNSFLTARVRTARKVFWYYTVGKTKSIAIEKVFALLESDTQVA